jgi:hypothetical protein
VLVLFILAGLKDTENLKCGCYLIIPETTKSFHYSHGIRGNTAIKSGGTVIEG